ncbi:lytic transglycosylase domain-containing protein [Vibrio parahaemolyticus]
MKKYLLTFMMLMTSHSAFAHVTQETHIDRSDPHHKSIQKKQKIITCLRYCQEIKTHSKAYNVPEKLIVAIIYHESHFNNKAVSNCGAKGLMQLMDFNSKGINPFDPNANIQTGTALIARLLKKYNSVELALAAYNAGEGNVAKYKGVPPFPETQQYIKKVLRHYKKI